MKKNFQSLNFKIDKKLIRYANKKIKKLGWKENKNFKIEIKKLLEKKSILK